MCGYYHQYRKSKKSPPPNKLIRYHMSHAVSHLSPVPCQYCQQSQLRSLLPLFKFVDDLLLMVSQALSQAVNVISQNGPTLLAVMTSRPDPIVSDGAVLNSTAPPHPFLLQSLWITQHFLEIKMRTILKATHYLRYSKCSNKIHL